VRPGNIDAALKGLPRKDAGCTCTCDNCVVDGNCAECDDLCAECDGDACEGCVAARADDAAIADTLTAAAAVLQKLTA
jgi:hypothetical protein